MINEFLIGAGFGIIGGIVRILIESFKNWSIGRFSWPSFFVYSAALIIIGAFSGMILSFGKLLSFLGGYAGLDLMDGFYSSFKKKKIVFSNGKNGKRKKN